MKRLFILLAFLVSPLFAQSTATVSPEYPWRLQVELSYAGGVLSAAPITQFYRSDVTVGGTVVTTAPSPIPSLTVDLIAHGADTVTSNINGTPTTLPVSDIVTALQTYLAQQRAAQLAPPSP